jgi:hypothetical protein
MVAKDTMTKEYKEIKTATYLNNLITYKAKIAEEVELEKKFAQALFNLDRLFTEQRQAASNLHYSYSKLEFEAKELGINIHPPYPPRLSSNDVSLDLYSLINQNNCTGYIARLLCLPHSNDNLQDTWIRKG